MAPRFLIASLLALMAYNCFAQSAATVVFVSGNVQIINKDGQSRTAVRGGGVGAGETVETSEGRVQLRFLDGANMSLQPATRFRVDEFRFVDQGGKASDSDRGFFSLLKGGFRTLTGLIGKVRREQYKVDTVVATIGIRGTDYAAQLTEARLSLSTFGGIVEVCSRAGCAQVAPGETYFVTDGNSLPRQQGQGSNGVNGAIVAPIMPDLPPPKAVDLPEVAPPTSGPSTAPPMQGPNYSPAVGPYR